MICISAPCTLTKQYVQSFFENACKVVRANHNYRQDDLQVRAALARKTTLREQAAMCLAGFTTARIARALTAWRELAAEERGLRYALCWLTSCQLGVL